VWKVSINVMPGGIAPLTWKVARAYGGGMYEICMSFGKVRFSEGWAGNESESVELVFGPALPTTEQSKAGAAFGWAVDLGLALMHLLFWARGPSCGRVGCVMLLIAFVVFASSS